MEAVIKFLVVQFVLFCMVVTTFVLTANWTAIQQTVSWLSGVSAPTAVVVALIGPAACLWAIIRL